MSDNFIPTYELYGEENELKPDFWLHCETLFSRSSLHNFEISLHRHESFFQLLYIESGTGQANFDGVVRTFQTPCAILVPPGFNHGFAFSRDIIGHIVTILSPHMPFVGKGAGGATAEWLMQPQLISMTGASDEELILLSSLLRQVLDEFHTRKPYKTACWNLWFKLYLFILCGMHILQIPRSKKTARYMGMLESNACRN